MGKSPRVFFTRSHKGKHHFLCPLAGEKLQVKSENLPIANRIYPYDYQKHNSSWYFPLMLLLGKSSGIFFIKNSAEHIYQKLSWLDYCVIFMGFHIQVFWPFGTLPLDILFIFMTMTTDPGVILFTSLGIGTALPCFHVTTCPVFTHTICIYA